MDDDDDDKKADKETEATPTNARKRRGSDDPVSAVVRAAFPSSHRWADPIGSVAAASIGLDLQTRRALGLGGATETMAHIARNMQLPQALAVTGGVTEALGRIGRDIRFERMFGDLGGMASAVPGKEMMASLGLGSTVGKIAGAFAGKEWLEAVGLGSDNGLRSMAVAISGKGWLADLGLPDVSGAMAVESFLPNWDRFSGSLSAWKSWQPELDGVRHPLLELARSCADTIGSDAIEFGSDGSVTIGDEVIGKEEIVREFAAIERGVEQATSLDDLADWLIHFVGSLSASISPIISKMLFAIIVGIVSGVVSPLILQRLERSGAGAVNSARDGEHLARALIGAEQLHSWRIADEGELVVRDAPSRKSRIVDVVPGRKLVMYAERKKHWARIEYFDTASGEARSGWVFLRYLKKL